jgi:8-amino-7-oxononanoate synthase
MDWLTISRGLRIFPSSNHAQKNMSLLAHRLEKLKSQGLERRLRLPTGVDFSSNDYLGFAQDPTLRARFYTRLKEMPVGATGSRLLRGNTAVYEETEAMLAQFVQREAALLFSSGYMANVGLLSALLGPEDRVFSDTLNHASLIDGIQLSRAKKSIFPHRDYDRLEAQLAATLKEQGLRVIVTESVFSMEGTVADLHRLARLAEQYHALLIVDEAHATGIWGAGLVHTLGLTQQVFASIHPAGKALGAAGAWVAGSRLLRDYLIHTARTFIFSTAPLPALPILLQESLAFYAEVGEARSSIVRERAAQLRGLLAKLSFIEKPSLAYEKNVPIISIWLGENQRALEMSQFLQAKGWDIRAIRPPTVPEGTARLRITVQWTHTTAQLEQLVADMACFSFL